MTRKTERDLDKVLSGAGKPGDEDETSIAQLAKEIEAAFAVETPRARRERSMFVHALVGPQGLSHALAEVRGPGDRARCSSSL